MGTGSVGVALVVAGLLVSSTPPPPLTHSVQQNLPIRAPVVVVGVSGLTWSDVGRSATPRMWSRLAAGASAAAMTVHTVRGPSCPLDGWASLSAGRPAGGARDDDRSCLPTPGVTERDDGTEVADWPRLVHAQDESEFAPHLGLLGTTLRANDTCARAVGASAAVALADRAGRVDRYDREVSRASYDCPLTVVDGGAVSGSGQERRAALTQADATVGRVAATAPRGASVLVLSTSDDLDGQQSQLGVALLTARGVPASYLTVASTRWDGLVRLLDLPPTLLAAAGAETPREMQGTPVALGKPRAVEPATVVARLAGITDLDRSLRAASKVFVGVAVGIEVAVLAAALALRRWARPRWRRMRRPFLGALLVLAAVPVSAYLVTLTSWWRAPLPSVTGWLAILGVSAVVAGLVALVSRKDVRRLLLVLSGLTFWVLVADAFLGTPLHRGSPLGPSPLLGGRYYGFGNPTFAVFAVATLFFGCGVATWIRGTRRWPARVTARLAGVAVLAVGAVAVVVDVWPTLGADLGGGVVLVPAVLLAAGGVAGVRLTVPRVLLAGVAGVLSVALVAVADWLRPPDQRSHAGLFVQQVLDGDAAEVVTRKAGYALGSLASGPLAWLTMAALVVAVAVAFWPDRFAPTRVREVLAAWPELLTAVRAVLVVAVLGAVANDYGVRIATLVLVAAVPLAAVPLTRAPRPLRGPAQPEH